MVFNQHNILDRKNWYATILGEVPRAKRKKRKTSREHEKEKASKSQKKAGPCE